MPKRGQALNHKQMLTPSLLQSLKMSVLKYALTRLPAVCFAIVQQIGLSIVCVLMDVFNAKRKPKMNMNLKFHTFIVVFK